MQEKSLPSKLGLSLYQEWTQALFKEMHRLSKTISSLSFPYLLSLLPCSPLSNAMAHTDFLFLPL